MEKKLFESIITQFAEIEKHSYIILKTKYKKDLEENSDDFKTFYTIERILDMMDTIEGKSKKSLPWRDKKLNVVIPMAGAGSRFVEAGYTFPKPLIEVRG